MNLLLPAFQLLLSIIWAGALFPASLFVALYTNVRPTAAFSALRVFAISGRGWCISSFVFALGLVPVGTNLVSPLSEYLSPWMPSSSCVDRLAIFDKLLT